MQVFGRFQRSRLWGQIASDDPVAVRFDGDDEPWFAAVMGSGGIEFGVHMARGLPGLRMLRAWDSDDDLDEVRLSSADASQIGFSSSRWSELPAGQRQRLQRAGFNLRREASVPFVVGLERGERHSPDARAIRRLVLVTATLIDLQARSAISWDERPEFDACLVLDVSGSWDSPSAEVSWHDFGVPRRSEVDVLGRRKRPPPPETARWRAAENSVIQRAVRRLDELELPDDDLLATYFGSTDITEIVEFLRSRPDVHPALYCWTLENVRRPSRAPTVVESLLDEDLTDDERKVVEARVRASPTFVRIVSADADTGWSDVVDILTGERLRFHDWGVSQSTSADQVFAITPVRVDGVILPQLAGPLLAPGQVEEAFAFLEQEGLVPTPEGIAKRPHLLGRLWLWLEAGRDARLPTLQNTDGDPLEFHELVLHAADSGAVIEALARRPDVDYNEHEGEWTWLRERPPGDERSDFDDVIAMGRIQVIGDEILVSVNSAARARRIRAWLEAIPGVRFDKMDARSFEALRDAVRDRPLDDRPSAAEREFQHAPEVVELLTRRIRAHYVNWMDDSIPALAGRTPRQAVRTKKGRAQVLRMIHTLPSVGHGLDMEAIRRELIRELGLE